MKLFTQLTGIQNAVARGLLSQGTADGLKQMLIEMWITN
jgi:hypothetical protein